MQDITHLNFEAELVNASLTQPVLLDIWAAWCGPCKTLGPVLEKLEKDYAGRFKLVKLDADAEPEIAQQLSQMFGVRSIPFCVLFKDGQPADGFVGALPELEVRKFLDKHVAAAEEEIADGFPGAVGGAPPAVEDAESAIERLQAALAAKPADDNARYAYVRALLDAGRVAEARQAFDAVSNNPLLDARLVAAGHWISAIEAAAKARPREVLDAALAADKRDFEARFELAQTAFATGRFTDAMDALLEILMRDKGWRDELARKTYVAILETMRKPAGPAPAASASSAPAPAPAPAKKGALEIAGRAVAEASDPVVDAYRRKLSMALF